MKKLATLISALFFLVVGVSHVWALPPCPSSGYFHNCYGTYTFGANSKWAGDKYVGDGQNDTRDGQGTYTFANGDIYVGEYKDNKKHGQGTFTWTNGAKYVGEYKDGKRHGQGTFTFADGDIYVGEYKDGNRDGQGTYNWKDGRIWVGEWENSELSGYAITYDASGSINQEGIFKNGKFLRSLPKCVGYYSSSWNNCYGTHMTTNGDKYVGKFVNGKFHGQATYYALEDDQWKGDK